jgi:hypothetical protein
MDIGAGDTTVTDVADKCDGESGDPASMTPDGVDVKQSLSRVFVRPVTCIQNTGTKVTGKQMRGTGGAVSADDQINAHGLNSPGCIDEGFALGEAAGAGRKINGVCPKTLCRQTETGAGPGGVFEEQVGNDSAFEQIDSVAAAVRGDAEQVSNVKDGSELGCGEFFQLQQMLMPPRTSGGEVCKFHRDTGFFRVEIGTVLFREFIPTGVRLQIRNEEFEKVGRAWNAAGCERSEISLKMSYVRLVNR